MKINNQEIKFEFRFKQVAELCKVKGIDLDQLEAVAKDFTNAPLILSIGAGISLDEATDLIQNDERGFKAITEVLQEFSNQVVSWINPNLLSQTD